jgi:hypothetical protein
METAFGRMTLNCLILTDQLDLNALPWLLAGIGIDPATTVPNLFGRQVHIAHGGEPIREIIA